VGSLYLAFEALKKRLGEEGLFDPGRKRALPQFPTRIGLITSQSGAALRDFLQISRRRNPAVGILLFPALVQGKEAAATIIKGLNLFNRLRNVDFIVITRGGGSLEDLWAFNEEPLVRAVAQSALPVVSAVGHEVDFTLCDFAADLRAPTPSAAAEMTVPEKTTILQFINHSKIKLNRTVTILLNNTRTALANYTKRIFLNRPLELLRQRSQRVDDLEAQISRAVVNRLQVSRITLDNMRKTLEVLNPRAILERGFSIVYNLPDRNVIKSVSQVSTGSEILIEVRDGVYTAGAREIIRKKLVKEAKP
jgi:exodeoxyribonuclease VII large subunit